jgi:hypothetical protein
MPRLSQRPTSIIPRAAPELPTTPIRAIDRRNMALPLRCARAGAASRTPIMAMRAAKFHTTSICRQQAINSDVRITRYDQRPSAVFSLLTIFQDWKAYSHSQRRTIIPWRYTAARTRAARRFAHTAQDTQRLSSEPLDSSDATS